MRVIYNAEYERKLKTCFIGCGGHAYRNIYPVFAYLPVDLAAVCDLDRAKAEHFARTFGALCSYTDHREMLSKEKPDVVFIVTGYDSDGRSLHAGLAAEAMSAGAHAWIEKPPVNDLDDVALLRRSIASYGKKLAVGFKKMFFPANRRMKKIMERPEFGTVQTISIQYPLYIPTPTELDTPGRDSRRLGFLDHICHPVSLLQMLGGRAKSLHCTRTGNGSGFVLFSMRSGCEAAMHFPHNPGMGAPLERTMVTGTGTSVEVANNIRVSWFRAETQKEDRPYGREGDFTFSEKNAPITWEPEFSLGNLYNKNIFLLGYYDEMKYFCEAVLEDRPIEIGGIEDAEEGIRVYDAFRQGPDKTIIL